MTDGSMSTTSQSPVTNGQVRTDAPAAPARKRPAVLPTWLRLQALNVARHAQALRPFRREEFGNGPAIPSEAHIGAANALIHSLRVPLIRHTRGVIRAVAAALREPSPARLREVVLRKDIAHGRVQAVEKIWDFYFELFGQRQSQYAEWLLGCDRIALDCYQYAYMGLGVAKSIPAPPPLSYMRTGFSPATFRRGVPLTRLGRQLNPFPLIQLPYHRLVNPWTLGAVLHEVSHNFQNELGIERSVPKRIARTLLDAGHGRFVATVWTQWNRETFADLSGLLLGGPAVVGSLMDVVGRSTETVMGFNPSGVHPIPFLRTLLSVELLRRMGFEDEARHYRRAWLRLYPNPRRWGLPAALLKDAPTVIAQVVDALCYRPFRELGNKALAQVIRFERKEQAMIEEAAGRMAQGSDPGIIPERFLISATRVALENRLAPAAVIQANFYKELARR
jgi:hypothetical protein